MDAATAAAAIDGTPGAERGRGPRVLVMCGGGRGGMAALAEAARLVRSSAATLTLVTLAPQDTDAANCLVYTEAFNAGVRDQAAGDLRDAQRQLGRLGAGESFERLLAPSERSLPGLLATGGFNLVLLPSRMRYRWPFRAGRRLRRAPGCEVRIIASGRGGRWALARARTGAR